MTPPEIRRDIAGARTRSDVERLGAEVYRSSSLLDAEIRFVLAEAESLKLAVDAFSKTTKRQSLR